MKLNYDKETDSLYIHLSDMPAVDSGELVDGVSRKAGLKRKRKPGK